MNQIVKYVVAPAALAALAFAVLFPVFARSRETQCGPTCPSNLRLVLLGLMQYTQDYNEKFPLVTGGKDGTHVNSDYGWATSLQPYIKSTQVFQCPLQGKYPEQVLPMISGFSDYYFNPRVAGKVEVDMVWPGQVVIAGDGNDGTDNSNARYALSRVPPEWLHDRSSPVYRHLKGANYGFADGHVKWLAAEKVPCTDRSIICGFTFLPEWRELAKKAQVVPGRRQP